MSLFSSNYSIKVSFEDLDPMNIVWHGNYIRYMEQARCDMLSKLKYTYIDMKREGYMYPVAKMKTKYIKPAEFGDILNIKTEIVSIEPSFDINYTIYVGNEKIFEAKTMQIAVNIKTKESVYTPSPCLVKAISEANK